MADYITHFAPEQSDFRLIGQDTPTTAGQKKTANPWGEQLREQAEQIRQGRQWLYDQVNQGYELNDKDYGQMMNILTNTKDDWETEISRIEQAYMFTKKEGIPFPAAYANVDELVEAETGQTPQYNKTATRAVRDALEIGRLGVLRGQVGTKMMLAELGLGDEADVEMAKRKMGIIDEEMQRLQDYAPRNLLTKVLKVTAQSLPYTLDIAAKSVAFGAGAMALSGAIGEALTPTMLASAAKLFGATAEGASASEASTLLTLAQGAYGKASTVAAWLRTAELSTGSVYYDLRQKGVEKNVALGVASVNGIIQGAIETSLGLIPSMGRAAKIAIMGETAGASLAAKTFAGLYAKGWLGGMAAGLTEVLKTAGGEGLEEFLQNIADNLAEYTALAISKETDYTFDKTAGDVLKEAFRDGMAGFGSALLLGLPMSFVTVSADIGYARGLKADAEFKSSKESFIRKHMDDAPMKKMSKEQKEEFLGRVYDNNHTETKAQKERQAKAAENEKRKTDLNAEMETLKGQPESEVRDRRIDAINAELADIERQEKADKLDRLRENTENARQNYYEDPSKETKQNLDEVTEEQRQGEAESNLSKAEREYNEAVGGNLDRPMTEEEMDNLETLDQDVQAERARASRSSEEGEQDWQKSPEEIGTASEASETEGKRIASSINENDRRTIARITRQADFNTWMREVTHIMRSSIPSDMLTSLENHYNVKDGRWTVAAEDKFTEDLDSYMKTGKTPASELRDTFNTTASALLDIYDSSFIVSPEIYQAFKQMSEDTKSVFNGKVSKPERGGVYLDIETDKMSQMQRDSIETIANVMNDITHNDVHVYESVEKDGLRVFAKDVGGHKAGTPAPNGFYDPSTSTIYIDLNAGNNGEGVMLWTASHELTHFVKQWSPEKFNVLAEFLNEEYGKKGVDMETLIQNQIDKAKAQGREISRDTAYEEVVADSMQTMFTDTNLAEKLEKLRLRDADLWEKIKAFVIALYNRIMDAYRNIAPQTQEAKIVREMADAIDKISDKFAEALVDAGENFEKYGVSIVGDTAVKNSLRTWNETDKEKLLALFVKAGYDKKQAKSWINNVNGFAKIIADDPARLDYTSDDTQTMIKSDDEYYISIDSSTLCPKRRYYQGTYNAIMHERPMYVFTEDDILWLRQKLLENDFEAFCGFCYVESMRKRFPRFASEWLVQYAKDHKGEFIPTMDDLTSSDTTLRFTHPEIYDEFIKGMNKKGNQSPKVVQLRTSYKRELLRKVTPAMVTKLNHIGGIRFDSFSDLDIVNIIDMMQAIMDASTRKDKQGHGLNAQAYAKVAAFAAIFGKTGMKINLSVVASVDENGNLVFDNVEGIDINEALKWRGIYSDNVGTILVGSNERQIRAAMASDIIDFIIPFHRSGWNKQQYAALGLSEYIDHQTIQHDLKADYTELDRSRKKAGGNYYPADYWDYSVDGNTNAMTYLNMCLDDGRIPRFLNYAFERDAAEAFVKANPDIMVKVPSSSKPVKLTADILLSVEGMTSLCTTLNRARNQRAIAYSYLKFALENGFKTTNGYWKTLIDFKSYNNEGVGVPQQELRPDFNMEEARKYLESYEGNADTLPVAESVKREFLEHIKDREDLKYSQRAYHGTGADFESFDTDYMSSGAGTQRFGWGVYLTGSETIARDYAQAYLDTRYRDDYDFYSNGKKVSNDLYQALKNWFDEYDLENGNTAAIREKFKETVDGFKESVKQYREDLKKIDAAIKKIEDNDITFAELKEFADATRIQKIMNSVWDVIGYENNHEKLTEAQRLKRSLHNLKKEREDFIRHYIKGYEDSIAKYETIDIDTFEAKRKDPIKRNLYTTSIPDDTGNNYLKWDKKLPKKQYERIIDELEKRYPSEASPKNKHYLDRLKYSGFVKTGEFIYDGITDLMGSKKEASQFLNSLGYIGMNYPAGTIWGSPVKGARNYVIYNPEDITIDNHLKYSMRGTPSEIAEAERQYKEIEAQYKGTSEWLKAPNGQPTHLTERQWVQVRTPNFIHWFGDWINDPDNASKVLDPDTKEPMVVYHGTDRDFDIFRIGDGSYYVSGLYFSKYKSSADNWGDENYTKAVFLNIRNMNHIGRNGDMSNELKEKQREALGDEDWGWSRRFEYHSTMYATNVMFTEKTGIDGFDVDYKGWYIALQPNQIKSATDNVGTFSNNNRSILYSARDTEYLDAVNSGDMAKAQAMVDERAREMGYTIKAYHGTPNINTEKNPNYEQYVVDLYKTIKGETLNPSAEIGSDDYKKYWNFVSYISQPRVLDKIQKAYNIPQNIIKVLRDGQYRQFTEFDVSKFGDNSSVRENQQGIYFTDNRDAAISFMATFEYDPIFGTTRKTSFGNGYLYEVYLKPDNVVKRKARRGKIKFDELIINNPSDVKSADPVTYDDAGNVIPLSQRFNEQSPSLLYSAREQNEDTYREAIERGRYVPDDILEQYRGREWADEEIQARWQLRNDAGDYDDLEHFLPAMVRLDSSKTDDYYRQIWLTRTGDAFAYEDVLPQMSKKMVEKVLRTLRKVVKASGEKVEGILGEYLDKSKLTQEEYRQIMSEIETAPDKYISFLSSCFASEEEFDQMMRALYRHPDYEIGVLKKLAKSLETDIRHKDTTINKLENKIAKDRKERMLNAILQRAINEIFKKPPKMCAVEYVQKIRARQAVLSISTMMDKTRARLEEELSKAENPKDQEKIRQRLNKKSIREMALLDVVREAVEIAELRREGVQKRMDQLLEIQAARLEQIDKLKRPLSNAKPLDKTGSIESTKDNHYLERYLGFWADMHRICEYLGQEWVDWLDGIKKAFEGEESNFDRRRTACIDKMKQLKITADTLSKREVIKGDKFVVNPETGKNTYTHDVLMAWYIYSQNDDSSAALIYGNFKGDPNDEARMDRIINTLNEGIDRLSPEEKELADWMISSFDGEDWNRIEDTTRNVDNTAPEKIPRYFMMIRQFDGTMNAQEEPVVDLAERSAGAKRASVKKGFTKERIHNINWRHQKPIQLGALPIYMKAIRQQEHYIAFAQLAKDMKYVFSNVAEDLTSVHGAKLTESIGQWIDRVIDPRAYDSYYNNMGLFGKLISNSVVASLSWNALSWLKQFPSVAYFLPYCDGGSLINAWYRFMTNYNEMTQDSHAKSTWLKNRKIDDAISIAQEQLMNPNAKLRQLKKITSTGMTPFSWFDGWACTIGWNAVYTYNKEHGATEQEAIDKANTALLKTQPQAYAMFSPKAYSQPAWRTMLLFSRQMNQINQMMTIDLWNNAKSEKEFKEKFQFFYRTMFGVAFGSLVLGWAARKFKGYGDDDDDRPWYRNPSWYTDILKDIAANSVNNVQPFIGSAIANAIQRKTYTSGGYSDPVSQFTTAMTRFIDKPIKEEELNYDAAMRAITEAMKVTGLPSVAAWRAYKAIVEQDPWYVVIGSPLGGRQKKKTKNYKRK